MVIDFVSEVIDSILERKIINVNDSVLVVAGTHEEDKVFSKRKFSNVTIVNIDAEELSEVKNYPTSIQNFNCLSFADNSFDFVFVSAGLHHSSKPHAALLEMYRVAKKGIIVVEARDSWLMKALGLLNYSKFEFGTVQRINKGGVDNRCIPNFVFRWTEREFIKTLCSFNPTGKHEFRFYYKMTKSDYANSFVKLIFPLLKTVSVVFPKFSNSFSMVVLKPGFDDLYPWLARRDGKIIFRKEWKRG